MQFQAVAYKNILSLEYKSNYKNLSESQNFLDPVLARLES